MPSRSANLLPGPASTQLAIYCGSRVAGWPGAIVGGAGFILPGLAVILGLAALFLSGSAPEWARALGAGGGAAVAAVAVRAGVDLMRPSWRAAEARRLRWAAYLCAGTLAAVLAGPWLVVVLLGCGIVELAVRRGRDISGALAMLAATPSAGGWTALAWTAFKVGGLSYGGGFVIIPLMQADAVSRYHWMTSAQFLEAVALGQITPGPVVQTVAVVGYAAFGLAGGARRGSDRLHTVVRPRPPRTPAVRPDPHGRSRAGVPRRRRAGCDRSDPGRRRPARGRAERAVAVRRPGGGRGRASRFAAERHPRPARGCFDWARLDVGWSTHSRLR